MREHPAHVTVLHTGGISSLVLASGFMRALRGAYPDARLTLFCLEALMPVISIFEDPPDETFGLTIDPRAWAVPDETLYSSVARMIEQASALECDLFVSADLVPTWLTPILGAALAPQQVVGRTAPSSAAAMIELLRERFDLPELTFNSDSCGADTPEISRYVALLALLGIDDPATPALRVPSDAVRRAVELLAGLGQGEGPLLACFNAAEPERRWPLPKFCDAIVKAAGEQEMRPLLIANGAAPAEGADIRQVAAGLKEAGTDAMVLPPDLDIPTISGVLSRCSAFLGVDAGIAHIASAIGVPGVMVSGGGLWPAVKPWAAGTVAVINPLPCFGCQWDCAFGHPICLESIDTGTVVRNLRQILHAPETVLAVAECSNVSSDELYVIGDAAQRYRAVQQDRLLRFSTLVQLQHKVAVEERQLLDTSTVFREQLEAKEAELQRLAVATSDMGVQLAAKETELQRLAKATSDMREQLEAKETALQRSAAATTELRSLLIGRVTELRLVPTEAAFLRGEPDHEGTKSQQAMVSPGPAGSARTVEEYQDALGSLLQQNQTLMLTAAERLAALEATDLERSRAQALVDELLPAVETLRRENEALRQIADERLAAFKATELERLAAQAAADESLAALEATLVECDGLKLAADERLAELDKSQKERVSLQGAADDRLADLQTAQKANEALRAENAQLREAAAARLIALEKLEAEGERRSVLLADLTALLEERTAELERLTGRSEKAK